MLKCSHQKTAPRRRKGGFSVSAKDYLSRFFPGPPSPLWETDPEFMELFANFALDEVVNQGDLDDAARMMAILATLLG